MTDREKVIKGMEQFRADLKPFCGNHADWDRFDAGLSMLKEQEEQIKNRDESLEKAWEEIKWLRGMLKEQEEQSVIFDRQCEVEPGRWERKGFCPKCHQLVLWMVNREYCGFCGQKVKWE